MEQERINYLLEEFKELRKEIMFLEKSVGQYSIAAIIASISLLSGVGAIIFKSDFNYINNSFPIVPYFFLFPPLILVSILLILSSHRRDIHRIGTYIQVFIEENIFGDGWEVRLNQFRKINEGESLDHIPKVFWVIYLLSVALFLFAFNCDNFNNYKMLHFLVPAIEGFCLYLAEKNFKDSSIQIRDKYINNWKKVQKVRNT